MATEIQRLRDRYLSCNICYDPFKDPCTLACQHTFCRECLTKYTKTQKAAIRAKSLLCPNCKQMSPVPNPSMKVEDWVQQFKVHFLLKGHLDDFASNETIDEDAVVNPATDNHDISDTGGSVNVRKKRRVCKAHNAIVDFFCKECHKAFCQECFALHRRTCTNIVTIESMMPEMKSLLQENRDMLSQQLEKTESSMMSLKATLANIEEKKSQTLAKIRSTYQTAINLIRKKHKQLLDELDDITEMQATDLRGQLKAGTMDIEMYQQHHEYIVKALTAEDEMDIYDMYQMCKAGAITTVNCSDTRLTNTSLAGEIIFVEELDENNLNSNLQLGSLRVLKEQFDSKCTPTLVDTINIGIKGDENTPNPIDVTVLDVEGVETLVVTDFCNMCLKSFCTMNKKLHKYSLPLSSKPLMVTKLTDNRVAVSYADYDQITLVKVTNGEMVLVSNITTQKKYRGLSALTSTTVVAGCIDPPSLDIFHMTKPVHIPITTSEGLIQVPEFLSTTRKGYILMSNYKSKSISCLTPEGNVIFTYRPSGDRSLRRPNGITTSETGDILVADFYNNKVIQLTPTGDFVRDLVTSEDGIERPCGICLHKGKLYIAQWQESLKVFSVNRP